MRRLRAPVAGTDSERVPLDAGEIGRVRGCRGRARGGDRRCHALSYCCAVASSASRQDARGVR